MDETTETTFWKGSSSQWLNFRPFLFSLIFASGIIIGSVFSGPAAPLVLIALIFPVTYMIWKYLTVRSQVFELTTERLRITKGIFNQRIDEVELYRVKDMLIERKFWMRLTGLGSIHIQTSERSLPQIDIPAIRDSVNLREALRKKVEATRDKKRVREMDFEPSGNDTSIGEID